MIVMDTPLLVVVHRLVDLARLWIENSVQHGLQVAAAKVYRLCQAVDGLAIDFFEDFFELGGIGIGRHSDLMALDGDHFHDLGGNGRSGRHFGRRMLIVTAPSNDGG